MIHKGIRRKTSSKNPLALIDTGLLVRENAILRRKVSEQQSEIEGLQELLKMDIADDEIDEADVEDEIDEADIEDLSDEELDVLGLKDDELSEKLEAAVQAILSKHTSNINIRK